MPAGKTDSDHPEDKLEGLVHISELAWQLIDDPREIIKTGDQVRAKIIGIDDTRISLSLKALKKDPWTEVHEKYKTGDEVVGKVDKINPFGAFVYLDKNIHGLAHISEFKDAHPGKNMEDVITVGEEFTWKILSIEPKEHRMGLVLVKKK
jgi:small subunit ribosomal protein S1